MVKENALGKWGVEESRLRSLSAQNGLWPIDMLRVLLNMMSKQMIHWAAVFVLTLFFVPLCQAAPPVHDPDGKLANMSKPVQVYILLGQSNMLGFGKVAGDKDGTLEYAVKTKKLYPYLVDDDGNWTERMDVRNLFIMGSGLRNMGVKQNQWLTARGGKIGPEIGIGHQVGEATDAPVLILKSCIGNRALGWDLLPPGGEGFEFTDAKGVTWVHPGYKGSPERWKKGEEPKKINWYAGMQYDGDIARAKKVLSELDKHYPGAKKYEVAGFFWWQGDRDSRSAALSSRYEKNLVHLIKTLRMDFDAPNAKFVCASLGQTKKGATDGCLLYTSPSPRDRG